MPELPEVETIKRGLSKMIVREKLTGVEVLCEKSFIGPHELACGEVVGLRRFGKALVIDLSNGVSLMVHLRMTGQLIYRSSVQSSPSSASADALLSHRTLSTAPSVAPASLNLNYSEQNFAGGHPSENFVAELPNKQTRVILKFEKGTLYFNDQRKFGFVKVIPMTEVEEDAFIKKLAPEPWTIKVEDFYEKLQRRKNSPIKAVILDQTVICGLGNIYADEALFEVKIHPERLAGTLSLTEAGALVRAAGEVMERSIESGGSTMATYVRADGTRGDYLEKFAQVFRREGRSCPRCGAEIVKIRVAGRGTHICPECQRVNGLGGTTGLGEAAGVPVENPVENSDGSAYESSEKTGVEA